MSEVASEAVGEIASHRFRMPRPSLARIVQVGALIAFTFTCGIGVGTSHTAGQLAFSSDGLKLAGTVNGYVRPMPSNPFFMYGVIKIWDAGTGKILARFTGPGTWLRALAISPDDSTLAVAGDTRPIELWDLVRWTQKAVLTGHTADVMQLSFAPAGNILASASVDGEVRLWDIAAAQTRITLQVDQYGAYGQAFTPDGSILATCDSKGIRYWDAADGHLLHEVPGERLGFLGFVNAVHDSLLVRSRGHHGEVGSVLDGASGAERYALKPWRRRLVLSPHGRVIAAADLTGALSILDASSGRTLRQIEGPEGKIWSLVFSPDGKRLAAGIDSGQLCVWDTGTGQLLTQFSCGDPVPRWGPMAATILVWAIATISLRYSRGGS